MSLPLPSHKRQGFTLIELLITIAILGILMAVLVVVLDPAERFAEARDSNFRNVVTRVAEAVEACYIIQQSKATPGNFLSCDTILELKAASVAVLDTNFTLPSGTTFYCASAAEDFCIRFALEATTRENTYWRYVHSIGRSEASASSCTTVGTENNNCD